MGNPKPPTPTPAETELLKIFWRRGTATIRDVLDDLSDGRSVNTIATIIRRMAEKGLLRVADPRRPQRYEAVASQDETYRKLAEGLDKKFNRSFAEHVRGFLELLRPSRAEISEVKRMLERKAKR